MSPTVPTLLLPGLVCDEAVWAHARSALGARAPVEVAAYGTLASLGAMAEHVLGDAPPQFALAGHSMGGRVALEVVRRAPERVKALALLDTAVRPLAVGPDGARERAHRYELLAIARERGMAAMAERWVQGMIWPPRLGERALVQAVIDMMARHTALQFEAQIQALLARPDARPVLDEVRCPTLVLCGADDSWATADRHRDMARAVEGAKLVLVPECGHMSTLERPAAVTQALLDWYADAVALGSSG
jgi:pimeloyl-ACP methyl ester carboxylesterase